jgi:hypothetical protein
MRPGRTGALAVAIALALVGAGCGAEELKETDEGVPLTLGDLEINVQLTRFLNPADPEDAEYLAGQQLPPPAGKSYLAVFLTMKNTGDASIRLPGAAEMSIVDTTGASYQASPSSTDYAVPLGAPVSGGGEVPEPGTAGASGPTQGSIVLFLVDDGINENRPLDLEVQFQGETGTVELDI